MERGKMPRSTNCKTLYTIGHSTHPIEEFTGLLREHRIEILADVRSYPSSRRWPQFNQDTLREALISIDIEYQWLKSLGGGRQSKRGDSPHSAWKVAAFRAYADYADGPEFSDGLASLSRTANQHRTSIMCSEGLWWQCHRRIIADHLLIDGWEVEHILPGGKLALHELPDFATIHNGRLAYDGGQSALKL
jgi:uncharacterized protein (DUF488 family)